MTRNNLWWLESIGLLVGGALFGSLLAVGADFELTPEPHLEVQCWTDNGSSTFQSQGVFVVGSAGPDGSTGLAISPMADAKSININNPFCAVRAVQ